MPIHPNATRVVPPFPAPFISLPCPTALELYNQIPAAVHWNLDRISEEGVRFDANFYGYFNDALCSVFPVLQRFQVNPHYPIRLPVEVGAREHRHNISIELHAGRHTPRLEGMQYPDFVLTKTVSRGMMTPRLNSPFGLVEIKTSPDNELDIQTEKATVSEAVDQAFDYTERLSSAPFAIHAPHTNNVTSYVTYGKYYTKVITHGRDDDIFEIWDFEPWQFISEQMALPDRAPFLYRLCELAVSVWDP